MEGWKLYDPKVSVNIESGDAIRGTKTIEYLLLPEKAAANAAFAVVYAL